MPKHRDNLRDSRAAWTPTGGASSLALATVAIAVVMAAAGCKADWPSCETDNDCPQDEDCINGFCSKEKAPAPPPAQCTLDAVYFDFNESALTTEATAVLARDAECLKKVNRGVQLIGHTDPRGTQEYNLA